MAVTLRLREVPRNLEAHVRDAIEGALDGDWCVTLSQSHLDGQWHLQLEGRSQRCTVIIPAEASVADLERLLQRLTKLVAHTPSTRMR